MKSKLRKELLATQRSLSSESWKTYSRVIGRLCQVHKDRAYASTIAGLTRNSSFVELVSLADSLSSQSYDDATSHFVANQFASLIKKYPFPNSLALFEPEKKARETFASAEQKCSDLNQKFHSFLSEWCPFEEELHRMRGVVRHVLGDSPPTLDCLRSCAFGPGANVGVHGNATNLARKLSSNWSVTPSALNLGFSAFLENWQLIEVLNSSSGRPLVCLDSNALFESYRKEISIVEHNNISFVPKTVKTFRSIAVEPLINSFLQKGVDTIMRSFLSRFGIDLSDQSINSLMAFEGSLDDSPEGFVTIDLSSASDSISIGLCRNILPPDWFHLLDQVRSKNYKLDDKIYSYHKFCSMGNGFCFPLETLIFVAACVASDCGSPRKDFHVYGDDIIVRRKHAPKLIALLDKLGFTTNTEKTFIEGPFRESCGRDWYSGVDVRPFVLDFALDSVQSVFKFLNLSKRNSLSREFFSEVEEFVISLLPDKFRFFRPLDGPPDTGITIDRDRFMSSPFAVWSRDLQCWGWTELLSSSVPDKGAKDLRYSDHSLMMAALLRSSSTKPFTVRRKTRTSIRKVAYNATSLWDGWKVDTFKESTLECIRLMG